MIFIKPKVSVCIPLYNTEHLLLRCLESTAKQNFNGLEVIVVDDCSPAVNRLSGRKIVKQFSRSVKFPVQYIRHEENKGLAEVRRTAVYEAKGQYIIILDSDDTLADNAVNLLYEKAAATDADIVQGKAEVFFSDTDLMHKENDEQKKLLEESINKRVNKIFNGELLNSKILDGYLQDSNHNGLLWGKIFRKETYLEALNHIPPVYCTMAEDVLQYFWIALLSKKYIGIDNVVYNYSVNTGISSQTKIDDLNRWEKICSTASVFTAIYTELQEMETEENKEILSQPQRSCLNAMCRFYVRNNLLQLKKAVIPELQSEARKMLCDYWGENMVIRIEKIMSEKGE